MSADHDFKAKAEDVYGKTNATMFKEIPALMNIPEIRSACEDVKRQYLELKQANERHYNLTTFTGPNIERMKAIIAGEGDEDPSSPVKRKQIEVVSKYEKKVLTLQGIIANLKEDLEYLRLKLQDEIAAQKAKEDEEEKAKRVAAVDAELKELGRICEAELDLDDESYVHTINSDDTAHTANKDDPGKKLLIDFASSEVGPSTPSDGSNVAVDDNSPFSSPPEGSPSWAEKMLAVAQSETPREDEDAAGAAKNFTLETTGKFSLGNIGANANVEGALGTTSSAKKPAAKTPSSAKLATSGTLANLINLDDLKTVNPKKNDGISTGKFSLGNIGANANVEGALGTTSSTKKPAAKKPAAKKPAAKKPAAKTPSSAKLATSGTLANLINLDGLKTVNSEKNDGKSLWATTTTKDATGMGQLLPPFDVVVDPEGEGEDAVSQLSMGTERKSVTRSVSAENHLRSLFRDTVLDFDVLGSIDFHRMTSEEWKEYDVIGQVKKALESGYKLPAIKEFFKKLLVALHESKSFPTSSLAANIRTACIDPGRVAYVTNEGKVYVLSNMFLSKHFEKGSKDTLAAKFGGPNAAVSDKNDFPTTVGRFLIYLGALSPGYCKNGPIDVTDAKYAGHF